MSTLLVGNSSTFDGILAYLSALSRYEWPVMFQYRILGPHRDIKTRLSSAEKELTIFRQLWVGIRFNAAATDFHSPLGFSQPHMERRVPIFFKK